MRDDSDLRNRLEADRKDLLDLTLRNPLLNFRPRSRSLEFVGESPRELFRILVGEGKSLSFLPAESLDPSATEQSEAGETTEPVTHGPQPANPTDLKLQTTLLPDFLQTRLLSVYYAARTALEEQGVNTLFLALGFLTWFEDDALNRPLRAPLILIPVELERSSARERFRLRHDGEDLDLNLSLAEKLRTGFGVTLPAMPEPEEMEVDAYLDAVDEAVRPLEHWSLDREGSVLGFFSFGKFLMYRDLDEANWPEEARPETHPVVRALIGDGFDATPLPFDELATIDAHTGVAELKVVLDADATQSLALLDVSAGRNLVIQGPPGTGKSQTITNLIADALGRGRTVLFVAEKMAALEVVKRRLDAAGLGDPCLELHSYKMGKKAVLEQIRSALSAGKPRPFRALDPPGRREQLRARLDAYCDAINTPIGESGVTPHQAVGELLRLRDELSGVDAPPATQPELPDWSAAEFDSRLELVERLQDRLVALGSLRERPYFGCRRVEWLPGDEESLSQRLRVTRHATAALRESAAALARFLRLSPADNRAGCETMLRAARTVADASRWRGVQIRGDWLSCEDDLRELLDDGLSLASLYSRYDATLLPEAWEQDLCEVRRVLNTTGRRWWRSFSRDYRQATARLAALCRAELPPRTDGQLVLIDAVADARRLRGAIARHELLAASLFGRRWRGDRSDWRALTDLADALRRLHLDVREGRLPRGLLDLLDDAPPMAGLETLTRTVEAATSAHQAAIGRLVEFLDFDETIRFGDRGGLAERTFGETDALLESWTRALPDLDTMIAWNRLALRARGEGLSELLDLVDTRHGAQKRLTAAFLRSRYEGLLRRAYRERPELVEFEGVSQERMIGAFAESDRRTLEEARVEIALRHWERLPRHNGGGQLSVLRRELAKRARHLPVRQLMARAGRAVQAVKPVFLMSPLSVAAYLPPGSLAFDLVVFDEASQVRPLDALGALLRGRQAVIVGDSRQLPPSSFFDRLTAGDDLDDDEPTSEVESILGLFLAQGAPERMLRWHYRSRHESLIAVSNREFYDDRLVVFPSPDVGRSESGLIFRHLPDTVYDRGRTRTNPGEAEAVALAVLAFAKEQIARPHTRRLSLGVATFSAAQMNEVIARIERLRREEPACEPFFDPGRDDPFFVKNLENVQGDERDVIFISVGYGRTAEGTVSLNFGPLNTEGGERRLNVLITRARVRCEVFTNLTAADLDPGRTHSLGVRALRTFLGYAQTGRLEGKAPSMVDGIPVSSFETAVGEALEAAGFQVDAAIGSEGCRLDLGVTAPERPGRYVLGVLGDGPSYLAATSARDRDRLRPQVLEGLGWRLVRAWAPEWHRDPLAARQRLLAALGAPETAEPASTGESQVNELPPSPVEDAPPDIPEQQLAETNGEQATTPGATPYRLAELGDVLAGQDLVAAPIESLISAVSEVVKVEGPVQTAEVTRRIADAAGLKRLGPKAQETIESAMDLAVEQGEVHGRGEFLWPTDLREPVVRDRSNLPSGSRKLDLVAPEEIVMAVQIVVRDAFGMEPDAIPTAAGRLLGFQRMSEEMKSRVAEVVETMTRERRLISRGGHLVVLDVPVTG
jgi:hypothetical protein